MENKNNILPFTYKVNLEKCSYILEMKFLLILLVIFDLSLSCKACATSGLKVEGKSKTAGHGSLALRTTAPALSTGATAGRFLQQRITL